MAAGMRVMDLGAAPGSWSQIAAQLVGPRGRVVALDLLAMEPLDGVTILQGDFRDEAVLDQLRAALDGQPLQLVLSDMAPNITGTAVIDQSRALYLVELALELAREQLEHGGSLVVKIFQGAGFDTFVRDMRSSFRQVASRKPKSSRAESRELYLIGKGFHH